MHPLGVVPVQELSNLLPGLTYAGPYVHVNALVHVLVLDGAPQALCILLAWWLPGLNDTTLRWVTATPDPAVALTAQNLPNGKVGPPPGCKTSG